MLRVITWGVSVALITAITATIAVAQPGKGKALGHKKAATNTEGASPQEEVENSKKVLVCHIPPGNPDNAHEILVSENALDAHLAHADTEGECGTALLPGAPPPGGPGETCDLEGIEVEVTEGTDTPEGVVDAGDVLLIRGEFDLEESGTGSVTVRDEDGTQGTFTDTNNPTTDNADVTVMSEGDLRIEVRATPTDVTGGDSVLDTADLQGVTSQGVTCEEEEEEIEGTVGTTEAGDTVLRTSSGDVLKLEPAKSDSKQANQRLKGLKGQQVKVEGKLQTDKDDKRKTLKATSVKASGKINGKAKGKK